MTPLLSIRIAVLLVAALSLAGQAQAGGEMKKVCHVEKVKGKDAEVCKVIRVHQKLDGTKVPTK